MGRFFGPTPNVIASDGFFLGSAPAGAGKTWSQVTTGFEAGTPWFFGSYANGLYLITAEAGGVSSVLSSSDLVSFTSHNIAAVANNRPRSVVFGSGTYFTVLDNNPGAFTILGYTSPDLVTWTQRATGFPANLSNQRVYLPVFGNGVFLLVSQASPNYATSPDGATWTQRSTYTPTLWGQPVFDGTRFVAAVLGASSQKKIATSLDGISWTESTATLDFPTTSGPFWVGNAGTSQYIVGEGTDDAGNSVDGALTSVTDFSFNDAGNGIGWTPVFSGSSWARISSQNADIVSSSSGLTWSLDTVPATATGWDNVAFGGGKFIAVGSDGSGNLLATRGP